MPTRIFLQDTQQDRTFKSIWLSAAIIFFFLILFARLFYIQVIQAEVNQNLSKENRMQLHILKAPRGRILDRNGEVLARNRPSYSICVLPYKLGKQTEIISKLCKIRDRHDNAVFDSTDLVKQLRRARRRRFDLTRIKEDVSIELVSIIEEHSMELPGVVVETESRREYPYGPSCFHTIGYMSGIPESQFDSLKEEGYLYNDLIGKAGIEKQYEDLFRGKNGREYVEVNAYGKRLDRIANMPHQLPEPGYDLYLSIDARLQEKAREVFPDSLRGAIVAINPQNGEVLLMYSCPTADPNIFSLASSLRSQNWAKIATDPSLPLNNRAISGTYTPGSTFKLVSATAALASGRVKKTTHMNRPCTGAFRLGRRIAHCWNLRGHGSMDLTGAVRQSCNVYFFQIGLMLGDEYINYYARLLGLGDPTGVDLPNEKAGYLSGKEAHNKKFAKKIAEEEGWSWTTGNLIDLAIGQPQVLTPIQLARMIGTIANGKYLYRPQMLKEVRSRSGAVIRQKSSEIVDVIDLDSSIVEPMRDAMWRVTQPGGTAGWARVPGIRVGGKTGSAENPHGEKTHSLFVGTAPVDSPSIALAVVAENAGHGSAVAAPIAGKILRYYFTLKEEELALSDLSAKEE